MDKKTSTFGLKIGNGVTKEVYNDIKDIEKIINNIFLDKYNYNNFSNHSIIMNNSERLEKTYPYEEHFRTIGTKYIIDQSFFDKLDLNKLRKDINDKLENFLGVNKINFDKMRDFTFLEITVSFKDWKNLNNYAHIDYLKEQFEKDYSETFFGKKLTQQYIDYFDKTINGGLEYKYFDEIREQIDGYLKGYPNDISDYLKELNQFENKLNQKVDSNIEELENNDFIR